MIKKYVGSEKVRVENHAYRLLLEEGTTAKKVACLIRSLLEKQAKNKRKELAIPVVEGISVERQRKVMEIATRELTPLLSRQPSLERVRTQTR